MTGKEFADLCAAQAGQAYVWGGLGYALSESRLNQLKKLYPEIYTAAYISKIRKYLNKPVFDCVGLVKFFLWGNTEPGRLIKYAINGIPDTSANGLYNLCAEKGDIKDLPELPGLLLHRDGHVGIYLGGGKLIEARGVDYGVVISEVAKRDFRHWGKLPSVEYPEIPDKLITITELAELLRTQGVTGIII